MRITPFQQQTIKQAVSSVDPNARVYLFGSRVNDASKGGDIDLLVISAKITLMDKLDVLAGLHKKLGEQKIDLVVQPDLSAPFTRLVVQRGIAL